MLAIKDAHLHSEDHSTFVSRVQLNIIETKMRLICALFLCLVLLRSFKGLSLATESNELKTDQDNQLKNYVLNHEFCMENNKLLRNHIELLSNSVEEITHLVTEYRIQLEKVAKLEIKEIEYRRELAEKDYQIKELQMNCKANNVSVGVVPRELGNAQVIIEQVSKNLRVCEMENTEIAQVKAMLEIKKNVIVEKDQQLKQLEKELKVSVDKLEKRNPASCIDRDTSGVQKVTLCKRYTFEVLCNADVAGPGWTVIQQRIRGGVDFNRDWRTYQSGFGNFWDGDFFLGLEKIHRLTAEQPHELYIQITRFNGSTSYARYDEFAISGEEDNYSIKLGEFNGTATDEFSYHNNIAFSTYDRDNDSLYFVNCADNNAGGWWYRVWANSNLNGIYYGDEVNKANGIYWEKYKSLKQVKMMIRPKFD